MITDKSARERAREWARIISKPTMADLGVIEVNWAVMSEALLAAESELTTLRAKNEKLVGALRDAVDTIHDEFCGQEHHPLCEGPAAALRETEDGGKE